MNPPDTPSRRLKPEPWREAPVWRDGEVFFDFGPDCGGGDGLCFDAAGNL